MNSTNSDAQPSTTGEHRCAAAGAGFPMTHGTSPAEQLRLAASSSFPLPISTSPRKQLMAAQHQPLADSGAAAGRSPSATDTNSAKRPGITEHNEGTTVNKNSPKAHRMTFDSQPVASLRHFVAGDSRGATDDCRPQAAVRTSICEQSAATQYWSSTTRDSGEADADDSFMVADNTSFEGQSTAATGSNMGPAADSDYPVTHTKCSIEHLAAAQPRLGVVRHSSTERHKATQQRRTGTAGICGQLYESKLIVLVLFRALYGKNYKLSKFDLGSNLVDLGVFDDIVLRYKVNKHKKPRFIFVQCKHRENLETNKVTLGELIKKDGDFALLKLYNSYLLTKEKFGDQKNVIFRDKFENIDCEFVMYTPAQLEVTNVVEELLEDDTDLLSTNKDGKVYRFLTNDKITKVLFNSLSEWRAKQLGNRFARFVLSSNYNNIMSDELIKQYHVMLASHILEVSDVIQNGCRESKFRDKFFNNTEDIIVIFRRELYRQFSIVGTVSSREITNSLEAISIYLPADIVKNLKDKKYNTTNIPIKKLTRDLKRINIPEQTVTKIICFLQENLKLQSVEVITDIVSLFEALPTYLSHDKLKMLEDKYSKFAINEIKRHLIVLQVPETLIDKTLESLIKTKLVSLSMPMPSTFGNVDLKVTQRKRLVLLSGKIIDILQNPELTSDNVINIDDHHIGHGGILNEGDIDINGGIGGLVGNLFVLDENTKALKFNVEENLLPNHAKIVLKSLKEKLNTDLSNYRFYFNITGFPKLSWVVEIFDKELIQDFLNKFKFYSNQPKQNEVEDIVKQEMTKHYNTREMDTHAMFVNVHDKIQKWWMRSGDVPYINETCEYFVDAQKGTVNSNNITILDFIYKSQIDQYNYIKFNLKAIQSLRLGRFITEPTKIFNIVTKYDLLTSIKLMQYFQDKCNSQYSFIDLKYALNNSLFKKTFKEFEETQAEILIIKSSSCDRECQHFLHEMINYVLNKTNKKIILTSETKLSEALYGIHKFIEKNDEHNEFIQLTEKSQRTILNKVTISFQGVEVCLDAVIDDTSKHLIDLNMLLKLINFEQLKIGEQLNDRNYDVVNNFYVNRQLRRCLKIKKDFVTKDRKLDYHKFKGVFVTYNEWISESNLNQDILLVSDEETNFIMLCNKYKQSIHWFKEKDNEFIWVKSRGNLEIIHQYVFDDLSCRRTMIPKTIDDVEDKTVIISAGPGMGKSSLLSHLAIETKKNSPTSWIVRINLLEQSTDLRKWKNSKKKINVIDAVKLLYKCVGLKSLTGQQNKDKNEKVINDILKLVGVKNGAEITLEPLTHKEIDKLTTFEMELFNCFYNNGKVMVLFDGFDEISPDYSEQTIELFESLKDTNVQRLWITTRSDDIQNELENKLGIFCYKLEPFVESDQRIFFRMFCENARELDDLNSDYLLSKCIGSLGCHEKSFFTTPLHMYMILTIFRKTHLDDEDDVNRITKLNLTELYKQFINIKIDDICIKEKLKIQNEDGPHMKSIIEKLREEIKENHEILAVGAIFYNESVLTKREKLKLRTLLETIKRGEEKTGLVERVVDDMPMFVHRTFAEYFLVEFFCNKLQFNTDSDIIWEVLFNDLLVANDYQSIRKFIDCKLASDSQLLDEISDNQMGITVLLRQSEATTLIVAMDEGLTNIIQFWINIVKNNLNELNIETFTDIMIHCNFSLKNLYMLPVYKKRHDFTEFMLKILQLVRNVGEDFNNFNLFFATALELALNRKEKEILRVLINDIINDNERLAAIMTTQLPKPDYESLTIANSLNREIFWLIAPYLDNLTSSQLLQLATVTDTLGQNLMHHAANRVDFNIINFLKTRLSKKDFRRICLSLSKENESPIYCLYNSVNSFREIPTYVRILVPKYSVLWEDIVPLDDEDATELSEDHVREIWKLAAADISLLEYMNDNRKQSIKKMLDCIEYLYSGSESDRELCLSLLKCAVECNNSTIVDALFKNVKDTNEIITIFMSKFNGSTALHKSAESYNVNILLPYLNKLNTAQLMQVFSVIDYLGKTPAYCAAERGYIEIFEYLKTRLQKRDFRHVCLTRNFSLSSETKTTLYCSFEVIARGLTHIDIDRLRRAVVHYSEYIIPSDDEDMSELNDVVLRDILEIVAIDNSLFELIKNNKKNFFDKILYFVGRLSETCKALYHKLLTSAVFSNNTKFLGALLNNVEDNEQLVDILITKFNGSTLLHKSVLTNHIDVLSPYINRLDSEQLMRVLSAADRDGSTPAHYAAERVQFEFFNFIKMYLEKKDIRQICLNLDSCAMTPLDNFKFSDDTSVKTLQNNVIALWEDIVPSDDEHQPTLSENHLHNMYRLIVQNVELFEVLQNKNQRFITNMLYYLEDLYTSSQADKLELFDTLIRCAISNNNRIIVDALLKNVHNADWIVQIFIKKTHRSTILHMSSAGNSFTILKSYLDKLCHEQLVRVLTVADDIGNTPAHYAAERKDYAFFNYLMIRLQKKEFRDICLTRNRQQAPCLYREIYNDDSNNVQHIRTALYEYIIPSDEESHFELGGEILHDLWKLVAANKSLFENLNVNRIKFIKKMLSGAKHLYSGNVTEKDLFYDLLGNAITTNNDIIVEALLKNVGDTDVIVQIFNTYRNNLPVLFHACIYSKNINVLIPYLDKLNNEQLMRLGDASDDHGQTTTHLAAILGYSDYFYYFKEHLQNDEFNTICTIENNCSRTPVDLLFESFAYANDLTKRNQLCVLGCWLCEAAGLTSFSAYLDKCDFPVFAQIIL